MTLHLYLLGTPRIERDGRIVETDTRKAVALLAYLTVTGEYQSRETLAALLWPEMDDERARAGLRRTLSALRSSVGNEALYVTRDGLAVNNDRVWCDVTTFQTAITAVAHHARVGTPCPECVSEAEKAIALYRDPFMSGFSLRDSAEFDDWQLAMTEQLRRAYTGGLGWLVQTYSQSGEPGRALDFGRLWLAADPLREETHRWLMKLYAWNGARDAALRQYREAVRILDEELGVGPLAETTALYEAIQEGRLPQPVTLSKQASERPSIAENSAARTELPQLTGRESAWANLLSIYKDVDRGGRLAVVTGETGIGKTYLITRFLEHVATEGARTVTATCYEGEANLAYAPITAALRALLRPSSAAQRLAAVPSHWRVEAVRLVPEIEGIPGERPDEAATGGPGAQTRFFSGISETLCHLLNGATPGVFFLDDVHWADEATLDLLAYLARRLSDLPILVILSWIEGGGGNTGDSIRLRRLMTETQRAGTSRVIPLSRWRPSDVLELVASRENLRPIAAQITDRLYRETEGLPYFVVEYLDALSDAPDRWTMPPSVRDLLAGRLTGVDQAGLQLLQTAAVIGRSFDYTTLLEASGRSEDEVIDGVERLLNSGLIREIDRAQGELTGTKLDGEPHYDFTHPQLRSLVYDEINLARRRLLHRRVAAALQTRARGYLGDALASLIAGHLRLGGQDDVAADYYRRAGHHARSLFANRDALDHFQTALALGHPDAPALHEAVGDLRTLLGEYQAALQSYEAAAAQATESEIGRLEHKLGHVHERRGNRELAESHYCAALARYHAAGQQNEQARLNVDRSRVAYQRGLFDTAHVLAEEALAQADKTDDTFAKAQAHNTLGILARQSGQTAAARLHLERSLTLSEAAGTTSVRVAALNNMARLFESDGEIDEALALVEQAIILCTREGDRHREAALYNHRADIFHRAGREEASMTSLKQAVAIYAEIGMESGDWQPEIWKLTEW